jgi:PqqD family protein of HPr-rel-A system
MNLARSWRIAEPQALCWRKWADEIVVHNAATGSTHHLSAVCSDVLLTLLQHPAGIDMGALAHDISGRIEISDGPSLSTQIERALAELAELTLASGSPA